MLSVQCARTAACCTTQCSLLFWQCLLHALLAVRLCLGNCMNSLSNQSVSRCIRSYLAANGHGMSFLTVSFIIAIGLTV